jgi:DNA-binding beta-propeller fold protein YncE
VAVVDVASATVTKTIAVGADVFGGAIALDPGAKKAVVAVFNACRVLNLVTNAVSADISTASVEELYTTADGLYAFCVGFNGSLISYASQSLVQHLNAVVNVARGAVSFAGPRAAGAGVSIGEDLLIFDTNGPAGMLVHHQLSGPTAEGDKTRQLAISADGALIATTEILSDTVSIRDSASGALLHNVPAGDRPAEVAFSPDGSLVVVANLCWERPSSHGESRDSLAGSRPSRRQAVNPPSIVSLATVTKPASGLARYATSARPRRSCRSAAGP